MAQNRKPPAYQEYSSEILANRYFRQMSLAERGLLYTLRLECWTNLTTPSKKDELAKYLGLSLNELEQAFTTRLDTFIEVVGDDLRIPEIDDYRKHLQERHDKQSRGGKAGAKITNKRRAQTGGYSGEPVFDDLAGDSTTISSTTPTTNLQHTRQGTNDSLVEFNQAKSRKAQSVSNLNTTPLNNYASWVDDYEKASNGG